MTRTKVIILAIIIFVFALITCVVGWGSWINWVVFICVASSLIGFFYGVEGNWRAFIYTIISYGVYIPFCIMTRYYGELIVSIVVILVSFVTLAKWKKNTKRNIVKINKLSFKEIFICTAIVIAASVTFGCCLRVIGSAHPFLNAICTVSILASLYYGYRISRQENIMIFLNYVCYFMLWIMAGIESETGFILLSIGAIIEMCYLLSTAFPFPNPNK